MLRHNDKDMLDGLYHVIEFIVIKFQCCYLLYRNRFLAKVRKLKLHLDGNGVMYGTEVDPLTMADREKRVLNIAEADEAKKLHVSLGHVGAQALYDVVGMRSASSVDLFDSDTESLFHNTGN